jgi:hypothetical protein
MYAPIRHKKMSESDAVCYIDCDSGLRACANDVLLFREACKCALNRVSSCSLPVYYVCGNCDAACSWGVLQHNYDAYIARRDDVWHTDAGYQADKVSQAIDDEYNNVIVKADGGNFSFISSYNTAARVYLVTNDYIGCLAVLSHNTAVTMLTIHGFDARDPVTLGKNIRPNDVAATILQLLLHGDSASIPACVSRIAATEYLGDVYNIDDGDFDLRALHNVLHSASPPETWGNDEGFAFAVYGDDTVSQRCAENYFDTLSALMRHYVNAFSTQKQACVPYMFSYPPPLHALCMHVLMRGASKRSAHDVLQRWDATIQQWATLHPSTLCELFPDKHALISNHPALAWTAPLVHGNVAHPSRLRLLCDL